VGSGGARRSSSVRVSGRVRRAWEVAVWAAGKSTLPGRNAYRTPKFNCLHHQYDKAHDTQREKISRSGAQGDGKYKFDFHESFIAVIKKIPGLPRINPDNTKKKLSAETQSEGGLVLFDDCLC